jgi:hypothetical protein
VKTRWLVPWLVPWYGLSGEDAAVVVSRVAVAGDAGDWFKTMKLCVRGDGTPPYAAACAADSATYSFVCGCEEGSAKVGLATAVSGSSKADSGGTPKGSGTATNRSPGGCCGSCAGGGS